MGTGESEDFSVDCRCAVQREKEKKNLISPLLASPGQRRNAGEGGSLVCAQIGIFRTVSKIIPRPSSVDLNALPAALPRHTLVPPRFRYPTPQDPCMKPDQPDARALT